jgi:hypothetical protein
VSAVWFLLGVSDADLFVFWLLLATCARESQPYCFISPFQTSSLRILKQLLSLPVSYSLSHHLPTTLPFPRGLLRTLKMYVCLTRRMGHTMWRCTLQLRARYQSAIGMGVVSGTSISFLGMGTAGKFSRRAE